MFMKRLLAFVLAVLCMLPLCACVPRDYVAELDGVWLGDGSMEHVPLVGAKVLRFQDGTLIVEGGMGAGEYGVKATDDTLTVSPDWDAGAFGFTYRIKGDTLILSGDVEFHRVG